MNCSSFPTSPLSNCTRLPRASPWIISLKSPGLIGKNGKSARPARKSTATNPSDGDSSVSFRFRQLGWLLQVDHSYCLANSWAPILCNSSTKSYINSRLARYSGDPRLSASTSLPFLQRLSKSRRSSTSNSHVRPSIHSLNSPQLPSSLSINVAYIFEIDLSSPNRIFAPRRINFCQSAPDLAAAGFT